MRTLSTALRKVYEAEGGYAVHSRARLSNDSGSTWQDLRSLRNRDFYMGASWTESVDSGITELHLYLRREVDSLSLSPYIQGSALNNPAGSYEPLLQDGHSLVQVQVAIRPLQATPPEEADWLSVFEGLLVAFGGGSGEGVLDCYCRDMGAFLMHTFIEEEREYGSDSGTPLETVVAQILSDNYLAPGYVRWAPTTTFPLNAQGLPRPGRATGYWYLGDFNSGETTGVVEPSWPTTVGGVFDGTTTWYLNSLVDNVYLLYTPTSPGWDLGRYKQKCEPVFTACETLAMQLGWVTRYAYDSSDAFRFTLWAPDRDAISPVYTLKEYQRLAVPTFGAETDYIRNAVEIPYFDKADLDASGAPKLKRVLVDKDYAGDAAVAAMAAASETSRGRRFMRYAPAAGANIDTQSEAERLGEAAIKDLAEPMVDAEVTTSFLHFLQLGDLITLPADNVNHDTDMDVAVTVIKQALTADGRAATTLGVRGRPQVARIQWIERAMYPHSARPLNLTGPDAVSNVTVEETTEGTLVWFDEPLRGVRPFDYELHLSTSSGFTPDDTTLYSTTRTNQFTVTSLTPGTTYYAKVVPRSAPLESNRAGLRGTVSAQATIVPRYVEPRRLQPKVVETFLPRNGSFEAQNDASAPPDTFTFNGTWNTDAERVTGGYSGGFAVRFNNTSAGVKSLTSQQFTVREGEIWIFSAWYKQNTATTVSGTLTLTFIDASQSTVSTASVNLGASVAANTWTRAVSRVVVPSTAVYAEMAVNGNTSYGGTLTVDGLDTLRAAAWGAKVNVTYSATGWVDANAAVYGPVNSRTNDLGEVELRGVALAPTPAPAANASIFTLLADHRPTDYARVFDVVTGTGATARITIPTTGVVTVSAAVAAETISFDGVRFFVD